MLSPLIHRSDAILLHGCYAKEAASITLHHETLWGFQLLIGESEQRQSKTLNFYSHSKAEIQEWLDCLRDVSRFLLQVYPLVRRHGSPPDTD